MKEEKKVRHEQDIADLKEQHELDLANINNDLKNKEHEIKERESTIARRDKDLKKKDKEIAGLMEKAEELNSAERDMKRAKQKIQDLEEDVEALEEKAQKQKKLHLQEIDSVKEELEKKLREYETKLEELLNDDELEDQQDRNKHLEEELELLREEMDEQRASLEEEVNSHKKKLSSLKNDHEKVKKDHKSLKDKHHTREKSMAQMQQMLNQSQIASMVPIANPLMAGMAAPSLHTNGMMGMSGHSRNASGGMMPTFSSPLSPTSRMGGGHTRQGSLNMINNHTRQGSMSLPGVGLPMMTSPMNGMNGYGNHSRRMSHNAMQMANVMSTPQSAQTAPSPAPAPPKQPESNGRSRANTNADTDQLERQLHFAIQSKKVFARNVLIEMHNMKEIIMHLVKLLNGKRSTLRQRTRAQEFYQGKGGFEMPNGMMNGHHSAHPSQQGSAFMDSMNRRLSKISANLAKEAMIGLGSTSSRGNSIGGRGHRKNQLSHREQIREQEMDHENTLHDIQDLLGPNFDLSEDGGDGMFDQDDDIADLLGGGDDYLNDDTGSIYQGMGY